MEICTSESYAVSRNVYAMGGIRDLLSTGKLTLPVVSGMSDKLNAVGCHWKQIIPKIKELHNDAFKIAGF
jgi:hypothetical protein